VTARPAPAGEAGDALPVDQLTALKQEGKVAVAEYLFVDILRMGRQNMLDAIG
jgi:hypothetical protein